MRKPTEIVKIPSTMSGVSTLCKVMSTFERGYNVRRKIHCQPGLPYLPLSFEMPEASKGLNAFPPNMPKKKMATRVANSLCRYQVESVYMAPGMYPASANPRKLLMMRNPFLSRTNICRVAIKPKIITCILIYIRGPI